MNEGKLFKISGGKPVAADISTASITIIKANDTRGRSRDISVSTMLWIIQQVTTVRLKSLCLFSFCVTYVQAAIMRAIDLVIVSWNMGYTLLDSLVCLVVVAVPWRTFSCPPAAFCSAMR